MTQSPADPLLSIVLPCYNPVADWHHHVIEAIEELRGLLGFMPELVIVNDGGQLRPADQALLQQHLPQLKLTGYADNKGKGAAVRYGVSMTKGQYVIYTDIDFPYSNESLMKVWLQLYTGQMDVVIGTKDESYYQKVPAMRVFISKFLRKLIGICFRMPITDTQCGLKGFNQRGKDIMLRTTIDRYLFDLEFVYQSYRHKPALRIGAQPSRLKEHIEFRHMNYKVLLSEGWNFLKILFQKK